MKNVEYLVGSPDVVSAPLPVFSDEAMDFAAALSKNLMKSPVSRLYPDISAFAFWCRRANLQKRKESCPESRLRLGRGLCFHLAPGNIPINFAFSYLFGLLAGCSNVVRLSSRDFPQIRPVCDIFNETLADFPEIAKRTAFVRYGHDDDITAEFCKQADARLIWGGDATIEKVRAMPAKPRCVDVCFADRYSVCVMDGKAVEAADEAALARLADDFYNDTYLMDQNACSSPQILFWLQDSAGARKKFWSAVESAAAAKYVLQSAVGVDKYTRLFEDVLDGRPVGGVSRETNLLYRVELSNLSGDLTALRGMGGYFYEYAPASLEELATFITEKFQTVTYFGADPETLQNFVIENRLSGIDRIVPVGKALDIDILWDGFDLARTLSRYVDAR